MNSIRATQDNVIIRIEPEPETTKSGLILPTKVNRLGTVEAVVVAVGPGYYRDSGHGGFVPTTVKVGDRVLVDALAGQDYSLDVNVPRHNKGANYGDYRICREEEIHAIVEPRA